MATLTIRNFPDALYDLLKRRAAQHRRSLNSEAILAVERALTQGAAQDPEQLLAALRSGRTRLKGVFVTDEDLRSARDEGRA